MMLRQSANLLNFMLEKNITEEQFEILCQQSCMAFCPSYSRSNDEKLLFFRLYNFLCKDLGLDSEVVSFEDTLNFKSMMVELIGRYNENSFQYLEIAENRFAEAF